MKQLHPPSLSLILLAALLLSACQISAGTPENDGQDNQAYLALVSKSSKQGVDRPAPSPIPIAGLATPTVQRVVVATPEGSQPAASRLAEPKPSLPDSEVVFGPSTLDFDVAAYLKQTGGFLGSYHEYLASTGWTSAADILERVALENSINPRLLLALLEYQCGCVRGSSAGNLESGYVLGVEDYHRKGLYGQLWWATNQLSAGYYGWQEGWLKEIPLPDGVSVHPAPDSNPGSLALQVYFARLWAAHDLSAKMGAQAWAARHPNPFGKPEWRRALDPQQGFLDLYQQMFGDAWERARRVEPLIPPGLRQLELILPFEPGRLWSFTSGPHKAWESESSLAALDFAPASDQTGCLPTDAWVVAVGDGPIVRAGPGLLIQDLDGQTPSDGKEQTGWAILYMHIAEQERVAPGAYLRAGQRIGRPSCEGGPATGTHLHIARKYNGVWMAAGGALPFVLDGWTVQAGQKPYEGTLVNDGHTVVAHPYASFETHISRPEFVPSLKPRMLPNLGSDEN